MEQPVKRRGRRPKVEASKEEPKVESEVEQSNQPEPERKTRRRRRAEETENKQEETSEVKDLVKEVSSSNALKGSAVKKLVYKAGILKVKSEALDQLSNVGISFLSQVLSRVLRITVDKKSKSVGGNDVKEVLNSVKLRSLDKDNPPLKSCETFREDASEKDSKKKSGELAEQKVKYYRRQADCVFLPRAPFKSLVRNMTNVKLVYKQSAIDLLQAATEAYLVELLEDATMLTSHRSGKTLEESDLKMASKLRRSEKLK